MDPEGAKIIALTTRLSYLEKFNNYAQKSIANRNYPMDRELLN